MQELIATVERFRGEGGCAWFEAQTHRSLVKYLVEETAELVDAVEVGDDAEMREELGDVLFQVLFHANIAAARGAFTLDEVAAEQRDKLHRRNPHVFGPNPTRDIPEIIRLWEAAKAAEKRDRTSVLDGVARSMPALALAEKVLGKGARVGVTVDRPGDADARGGGDAEAKAGTQTAASQADAPAVVRDADGRSVFDPDSDAAETAFGEHLLAEIATARDRGIDPERALRAAVRRLEQRIRDAEAAARPAATPE